MSAGPNNTTFKIRAFGTPSAFDPHYAPSSNLGVAETQSNETEFIFNGTIRGQLFATNAATGGVGIYPTPIEPYPAACPGAVSGPSCAYPLYFNYQTNEIFFYYNSSVQFPSV